MGQMLPYHPTMRDPRTGLRLQALWVDPLGRARYPIMGGAPDDPPGNGGQNGGDGGGSGGSGGDGGQGGNNGGSGGGQPQRQSGVPENYAIDDQGASLGYPVQTPVKDMTVDERAAYHLYQSRKHETRNKAWNEVSGGKTPEQVKADLERLAQLDREKMTEQEKAVADAEKRGQDTVTSKVSTQFAGQLLGVALAHVSEERRTLLVEGANLSQFVNSDGTVDADKVTAYAEALAPKSDKDSQNRDADYGAGRRGSSSSSGVAAGRTAFQERQERRRGRKASDDITS